MRAVNLGRAAFRTPATGSGFKPALACVVAVLLSACGVAGAPAVPTGYPVDYLPTVVAQTGEAAFATAFAMTPIGTSTPPENTPTPAAASSMPAPTPTPTLEPGFGRFAEIRFLSPGPMSRVVSPIHLQVLLVSGESGVVLVELLGEDGRALARQVMRVDRDEGGAYRGLEIPFEIRAAGELASLQISSEDEFGRQQNLNTLPLLLLSLGENQINPPGNLVYERVALEEPAAAQADTDGVVDVSGRFWPVNNEPFFLELVLPNGRIAGARVLALDGLEPQAFQTTVPYKLPPAGSAAPLQAARLVIRQMDPSLGIPLYVYSRELRLQVAP